jgi:hypothetical protein
MPHSIKGKKQLWTRARRIKGQADPLGKMLEQETKCSAVLQPHITCRSTSFVWPFAKSASTAEDIRAMLAVHEEMVRSRSNCTTSERPGAGEKNSAPQLAEPPPPDIFAIQLHLARDLHRMHPYRGAQIPLLAPIINATDLH